MMQYVKYLIGQIIAGLTKLVQVLHHIKYVKILSKALHA